MYLKHPPRAKVQGAGTCEYILYNNYVHQSQPSCWDIPPSPPPQTAMTTCCPGFYIYGLFYDCPVGCILYSESLFITCQTAT